MNLFSKTTLKLRKRGLCNSIKISSFPQALEGSPCLGHPSAQSLLAFGASKTPSNQCETCPA